MADRLIPAADDKQKAKNKIRKKNLERRNGFSLILPLMMLMIISFVVVFCVSQLKMQIQMVHAARLSSLYQSILEQSKEMAASIVYQRRCRNDTQIEKIRTFETEDARVMLQDCTNYLEATVQGQNSLNSLNMILWIYYSEAGLLGYDIQMFHH